MSSATEVTVSRPEAAAKQTKREIEGRYLELLSNLDRFHGEARRRLGSGIVCRSGCSDCCKTHLSVFRLEAERIRDQLAKLPDRDRRRLGRRLATADDSDENCAFLVEGECAIYPFRPMLCRIHGFPTASHSFPKGAIDLCELNLTEMKGEEIDLACVLDWDSAGEKLALLNFLYGETIERERHSRLRIPLVEIAREGVLA